MNKSVCIRTSKPCKGYTTVFPSNSAATRHGNLRCSLLSKLAAAVANIVQLFIVRSHSGPIVLTFRRRPSSRASSSIIPMFAGPRQNKY